MFNGVPKQVVIVSLLGLTPILVGVASTFNIGIRDSLKEEFIRIALIYSGFILSFMSGCIFYVSSLERERVLLVWLCIAPVLLALFTVVIPFMQGFFLALGFLVVLEIERKLHKLRAIPEWWLSLRFPMTTVVVVLLIFLGFRI